MKYATSFDLESLPIEKHSHVPYVVVLIQAMEAWKKSHNGQKPKSFAEKGEFKELIKSMAKEADKELNFDEAMKNAFFMH